MWPFGEKKEPKKSSMELEVERLKAEWAATHTFLKENFPVGTEFIVLGVRFRVYDHGNKEWLPKLRTNYVNNGGDLKDATFDLEEAKAILAERETKSP